MTRSKLFDRIVLTSLHTVNYTGVDTEQTRKVESGVKLDTLRALRRSKKLTIYDMAHRLEISPSYYCLIEQGKRGLSHGMALAIANILECSTDEVFPRSEVDYKQTAHN